MNANRKRTVVAVGGLMLVAAFIVGAFAAGHLWAAGVPANAGLTYSGTLEDASGAPLTGSRNIQITFWNAATGGTTPLCQTPSSAITLVAGRFSVVLPDTCTSSVQGNKDVWVEVLVDGNSLGFSKLGAVPYAIEAGHATTADNAANATNATHATSADSSTNATHAVNADNATSAANASAVPWSGVTDVPVSLEGNGGSIQIGGSNRTLLAGNVVGNLHIDSVFGAARGWVYLDYYAGSGTIFGNGAGAEVGRIDTSGNARISGMYAGPAGGNGGVIRSRAGTNGVSFQWDTALHFYVEDQMVKTFIIPHPTSPDRYLVHTTLEGPENAVFYRGTAHLRGGMAEISLPAYFEAATREEGRTVLVTPKFETMNEPISALAASTVRRGAFVVRTIDGKNPEQAFDWEVKAVRADAPPLVAEPKREDIVVHGDGPYRYFTARR